MWTDEDRRFLISRLKSKRTIDRQTGCWLWTGALWGSRGNLKYNGRLLTVHRLAASLWLDFDLDSKLQVNHHCDVPHCFNPSHIYIGTHADNMRDYRERGSSRKSQKADRWAKVEAAYWKAMSG